MTAHILSPLLGKSITKIEWNEEYLVFHTHDEPQPIAYVVEGDCCSHSYFYDFFGVEHLLRNGPVIHVGTVDLEEFEKEYDVTRCYGYTLVTEHPVWGAVTSVFSFRNDSNGYYGGDIRRCLGGVPLIHRQPLVELTHDVYGD